MNEEKDEDVAVDDAMMPPENSRNEQDAALRASRNAEDRAWVAAAQAGDRQAFGKLVERYQQRVYALAFGMLRNREDAWDVAQDSFVKAYKKLDRFEGNSSFYTWVYRITHNRSIDLLRERARRQKVDIDDGRSMEEALERDGRKPLAHPDERADRKELTRVLHEAMDKLSDKHRAIIVLREIEGLSYEEMANVLEISKGTVMSRLFHARQNLQKLLGPYVSEGDAVPGSLRLATQS